MKHNLPTKKAFKAWLEANPNKTFIQSDGGYCPIAGYFRKDATEEVEIEVSVDTDQILVEESTAAGESWDTVWATPKWAAKFIEKVDNYETEHGEVTGSQALQCL